MPYIERFQLGDLVEHERFQWRNNNRDACLAKRWYLVTNRFTTTVGINTAIIFQKTSVYSLKLIGSKLL